MDSIVARSNCDARQSPYRNNQKQLGIAKAYALAIASALLALMMASCNTGYVNNGETVVYKTWDEGRGSQSEIVRDADAKTFKVLTKEYAKDRARAYFEGRLIKGAIAASFVALSETFAKDERQVYFDGDPVAGADPATFQTTADLEYGRDKNDIFLQNRGIKACDVTTFRWLPNDWQIDGKCVYNRGAKLPNADPASLIVINSHWAKDKTHVYMQENLIEGADPQSFHLANGGCIVCAQDKYHCYKFRRIVSCDSFE